MIPIECPKCGREGHVPPDRLNAKLTCRGCQAVFHLDNTGRMVMGPPGDPEKDKNKPHVQYSKPGPAFDSAEAWANIPIAVKVGVPVVLLGLFVALKAVAYWLDRYSLLLSPNGGNGKIFSGASYTDLNAVLPAKIILLFISLICAAAFFAAVFRHNLQLPSISIALLVLSSVLVGAAWPAVLEQFVVKPNANTREQIPILVSHTRQYQPIGKRRGFFDVAATVAQHLDLPAQRHGTPFR